MDNREANKNDPQKQAVREREEQEWRYFHKMTVWHSVKDLLNLAVALLLAWYSVRLCLMWFFLNLFHMTSKLEFLERKVRLEAILSKIFAERVEAKLGITPTDRDVQAHSFETSVGEQGWKEFSFLYWLMRGARYLTVEERISKFGPSPHLRSEAISLCKKLGFQEQEVMKEFEQNPIDTIKSLRDAIS